MMILGGLYLRDVGEPFGTGLLGLGIFAIPVSVLVALSVINAFNFIDGIDGLAASMALIALTAGALATGVRASAVSVAAMACGATLGFLLFNFPAFRNRHLRAFMGDAGSTLLGVQSFIIRRLAVHLRHRRWRDSKSVVELPARAAATHSLMPPMRHSRRLVARQCNGQGHPVDAVRAGAHYRYTSSNAVA